MDRNIGLLVVGIGVALVVLGGLIWSGALSWFGRLPGDIRIDGDDTRVFIPITSMLVVSAVLTIVATIVQRLR